SSEASFSILAASAGMLSVFFFLFSSNCAIISASFCSPNMNIGFFREVNVFCTGNLPCFYEDLKKDYLFA
ncbi:MAG: hypothetical protein J6I68_08315, partial [Butyrivibrio sp.]|uniref:hypothetical protein n=1 Tax=Butyrivibrio sp. TaxID=28121 RepID=UPI001B4668BC